ncbi:hypothetical protein J2R95_003178 [Bradyrhizobium japonicum]|uniref:hypothetical protein n=1 Tax=Bradyrhizobium japonicum TaxID=375 RepID=UPI0020A17605|nr:hypothetical protein [Bradyrhizobium japonicum]MCP1937383.1 hypothetical protein [Bradyrhizobium japonicum]
MFSELNDIYARLRVHWHAVAVAVVAALPTLLLYLEGIDLRPILAHVLPANYVDLIVALLPFMLLVMKPLIHLEDPKDDE